MAYDDDVPSVQEVYDNLAEILDDADQDFNSETLRESIEQMTDEQLEDAYDIETIEELRAEGQDTDSPLKYH